MLMRAALCWFPSRHHGCSEVLVLDYADHSLRDTSRPLSKANQLTYCGLINTKSSFDESNWPNLS